MMSRSAVGGSEAITCGPTISAASSTSTPVKGIAANDALHLLHHPHSYQMQTIFEQVAFMPLVEVLHTLHMCVLAPRWTIQHYMPGQMQPH